MVKTNEDHVESFTVREATPDRIKRLYAMPELLSQPTIIRENGLIFAGQGSLLTFEKPSDILGKIIKWFPKEYAEAQANAKGGGPFFGRISLFGPYPSWQDEPAAFLTLWECMPQIAWAQPTQNPFMRRLNDSLRFQAIAARSSTDADFKQCVYERSGRIPVFSQAALEANKKTMREIGSRVTPVLQKKFTRFLSSTRCHGTGPDDCVLIMLLWSSLSPTDVDLAKVIQTLESEVAPDSPLPALQKPIDKYGQGLKEGERRFDEALRQAAFLRAKLTSITRAPTAWPPHSLRATLQQMSAFWLRLKEALKPGWEYYALDYYNEQVNPWQILTQEGAANLDMHEAILSELQRLASAGSCDVAEVWLKGQQVLRARFALHQLKEKQKLDCVSPDWNWLQTGKTQEARNLYQQYSEVLNHMQSGTMHEVLLTELTDYGKRCFEKTGVTSTPGLDKICVTWISEPQAVPLKLKHARLTLSKSKQFQAKQLQVPEAPPANPTARVGWLKQLAKSMDAGAQQKMQDFIGELARRNGSLSAATWWTHPHHDKSLIDLQVYMHDERSYPDRFFASEKVLLLLEGQTFSLVRIPRRFLGEHNNADLVQVSDLDNDGNLEAWWAESFRQCKGDESDLESELDCSAKQADMGEIKGDSLTYFVNTRQKHQQSRSAEKTPNAVLEAAVMPINTGNREDCNTVLVGSVLEKKLKISFQSRTNNGDVISLACKPHPQHPERTIVTLFHDLKDKKGQPVENKKGFVFGVINVAREKIYSLYRETIEEDASIRIDTGGLEIDTARYNLAPGVRALGVRMNIGYSPQCADGGTSGFLTLFVEEGKRLKPALKDLPMSMWRITEGSTCGVGDNEFSVDEVSLTLSVAGTTTAGWRDLELAAHRQRERWDGIADEPAQRKKNKQILGKLRWNGKMYSGGEFWVSEKIWPSR